MILGESKREADRAPALRVLHIEDDPLDTELVEALLEREGLSGTIERVATMEQVRAALAARRCELILCDYTIPGFDAMEALRLTRDLAPDLPFIFLSGTIGEELGIETLKQGATDYVLKQRIERLVPAIRRAVREAEEQGLRKRAEAASRLLAEKLSLTLESAQMGTFDLDLVTRGMALDARSRVLLGLPSVEKVDLSRILESVHPDDRRGVERSITDARASESYNRFRLEFRCLWPDRSVHWIAARGQVHVLGHDTEHRARIIGTLIDVTDRKQADEEREKLLLALREADRRKNDFLAMLSHELRNPLTPLRNGLYLLEHAKPGSEQALRARRIMERQVNHLTRIVEDLLDVNRILQGRIHLKREHLDFREVVRRALEDYQPAFAAKKIELTVRQPNRPLWVKGDRVRLSQAFGNVLQNAAKFTPEHGRVRVELREEKQAAVLSVRDNGMGIEADVMEHLFEPFVQADRSLARSAGGVGLGLAIVKGLTELHGGEVRARSDGPGKGAELELRLPTEPELTEPGEPGPEYVHPRGRRVLIIEDNRDTAESLKEVLELDSHEVAVAASGPEGLAKAHAMIPDIVVCDIGLPGMDGYQVARTLRADDTLKDVVAVALTGYAAPEDEIRARAAGFDRHIAKPPDLGALERMLSELG